MSNICALLSFLLLMNEMRRWKAKKEMKAKCRRCRGLYSWHHCTISKLIIQYSESWEIEKMKKKKKGYSLGPEKTKWRLFHIYLNSLNFNFLKKSIIYKRGLHHTLLPVQVRCKILDAWGWCTGTTQTDGMGREEGSGWGTHVYLWRIHFDIWQN